MNGHLELIKKLYNVGIYPDKYCIYNAIEYNHSNIIDWLLHIKYTINEEDLYHCIHKNRLFIFKKIFFYYNNLNINNIFNYAILYDKVYFINWIYLNNYEITIDNIFCAFQCKNKTVIEWLLDLFILNKNNIIFNYLVKLVKEKYKDDKYIYNIIHNYHLINILSKKINSIDFFTEINNFLIENTDIDFNIILKYDIYIYPILLASFLTKNMNTIFSILEKNKLINYIEYIIDDVILYDNRKKLNISSNQITNFFISFELFNKVDLIKYYSSEYKKIFFNKIKNKFYENGYLVYHKINFSYLINEPFVYNSWDEVIDDNKYIYIDSMNYGYIIDELLQHWKSNLNAYNYGIIPKYPTNPYTGQLINPIELYKIIIYAIVENIKIPFIVKFFAKHPNIVLDSYYKFNQVEEYKNENNYFLKDLFLQNNLIYIDSIAEINEGGKWIFDTNMTNNSYIFLYNMIDISYEIGILLFYYIWKNVI